MTTEDDFQRALDKHPDDWHTRLVFAAWLQERDDLRAEGYRAIVARQRRPLQGTHTGLNREAWWWHCAPAGNPGWCHNDIPPDWFALLPQGEGDESFWPVHTPTGGVRTRRECEDALARAFAALPAARHAELLVPPDRPAASAANDPNDPVKKGRRQKR